MVLAVCVGFLAYRSWTRRAPYFHGSFRSGLEERANQAGWQAFGGTWQVVDGAMQNISDDRGAKLMNGSRDWHNYVVEADVQLLGESGDAGFVIRASNEEVGVDSYDGYFAGIRDADETLIMGRADYGWHEMQTIPIHTGVHAATWYHLKVLAYECTLVASATTNGGEVTTANFEDENCLTEGRFGLQSYSTGAVWKNLEVRGATAEDVQAMLLPKRQRGVVGGSPGQDAWSDQRYIEPMQRELEGYKADLDALPIGNLKLLPPNLPAPVTVHGVVTMVSPVLFVQDSTGGIAIPKATVSKPVEIGDAVEARGDAEQQEFSSVLRHATVRPLWSHTPVPPVSVTASQAATGAFDAQFIETEGRLASEERENGQSLVLKLNEGSQTFLAIAENPALADTLHSFKKGSRLRLRGVCVTDRAFARGEVPFALLMRSAEDAEMVEAPPWWNTRHVVFVLLVLLTIMLGLQYAYISIKRTRLNAVMEERERLAHEMHDTLAQSFAGLGFQLEALCDEAEPGSAMRSQLESTVGLVRYGHLEARRNIAALRPGNIERSGLAAALEQAAQAMVQGGAIAVTVSARGEAKQLPLRVADTLFRIGQEAIANAVRHAHPHTIQVRLVYGKSSVRLLVRDDGQGFSTEGEVTGLGVQGFGIEGMGKRADAIGAVLRIRSSVGDGAHGTHGTHGTLISVRVSMAKAGAYPWWRRSGFGSGVRFGIRGTARRYGYGKTV